MIKLIKDEFVSKQFLVFCFVGLLSASQNILLLFLLTSVLNFHYITSIVIQMAIVNSISYAMNSKITFKQERLKLIAYLKYHTVTITSLLIVTTSMVIMVEILGLHYLIAYVLLTIVMTFYNFILQKKWSFSQVTKR